MLTSARPYIVCNKIGRRSYKKAQNVSANEKGSEENHEETKHFVFEKKAIES